MLLNLIPHSDPSRSYLNWSAGLVQNAKTVGRGEIRDLVYRTSKEQVIIGEDGTGDLVFGEKQVALFRPVAIAIEDCIGVNAIVVQAKEEHWNDLLDGLMAMVSVQAGTIKLYSVNGDRFNPL